MEDTQVVDWDAEEEEETERSSNSLGYSLEPIGRLHIFGGTHGPQKDYPLYIGKNVIGRSPECSVVLPFPSISKLHAVIEIPSWNKAALLQDCGSLNGTRIMRPPKILTSGINYRLRNKDLILLADFPCQYYRLDIPLPLVSHGPLTIEETPRVQGGTQPSRILLAEDSEEEVDFLSERCVANEPRITSSPLTTVVPESDEERLSAAPGVPGPSFVAFDLVSDTDEEEGQPPKAGEASSAAREGANINIVAEQPDEMTTGIQRVKAQATVQRYKDRKVKTDAGNDVFPLGVAGERSHLPREDSDTDMEEEHHPPRRPARAHLERAQPSGLVDSDTDVEEEGIPLALAVVPVKKRHIFYGVGKKGPRAPGLARLPERPAGRNTSVEEVKAPLAVPLERGQTSVVVNSDMDDEEEVSAALALAHLKESGAILWSRDKAMEEDTAQPQTASGRNSAKDTEEEKLPGGKRETARTDKDGVFVVTHSEKSQPPLGHNDSGEETDISSPGIQLVGSEPSTILDSVDMEEDVLPGPSVLQIPVKGTNQADVEAELRPAMLPVVPMEEGLSSAVAGIGKSQLPEAGDAGTQWVTAVLKQDNIFEEAQGRSPVAQMKQVVVCAGSPREPTISQREGAQTPTGWERKAYVGRTKSSKECYDDPEDLSLPATQCFVKTEHQSPETLQTLEDEPTQAFPLTLPQEPGPSHCSFQTPGALDVPWEVLSTQPFCLREFEVSEPQPIATSLEGHGSCPSTSRALPCYQHPVHTSLVHTEPLGTQGRETVEKDMGHMNCEMPPAEDASRGDSESSNPCRLHTLPAASAPPQNCLTSQSQKHSIPHPLVSTPSPSEPPIPIPHNGSLEAPESLSSSQPSTRPRQYTVKPHTALPTDQPATPKPTSRATRSKTNWSSIRTPEPPVTPKPRSLVTKGRTSRSSVKTPEPVVPTGPEFQPTSLDHQPATPKLLSRVTRSKTSRSTVRTSEPIVPIGPELQPATPKPVTLATQGRISRSSVKTPEPTVPTAPEFQPASSDQPATPKPIALVTHGRTSRSSVKAPEPIIHIGPEIQPPTLKPVSQATRGRTSRSSVKTSEVVIPTPELHLPTSTDQPVNPNHPISHVTRNRTNRSSIKTSELVVSTGPEIQPPTYIDQPVTLEPMTRATQGRAHKSSVMTPKPVIPAIPELQPLLSREEPVTPKPISRATRSRSCKSSTKTPESDGRPPPDLEPPTSTNQSITSEAIDQSKTLRSSALSDTPIPIIPDLQSPVATAQPAPLESSKSKRKKAAGKQGSHKAPIGHRPSSTTPEPESQSSTNQRSGVLRAAESLGTIPEPVFHQISEAHTHAPLTQNIEEAGRSGFTLEPKPEASQIRKRPSTTMDSSPLQKRPRRGVSQKTVFSSEEEDSANRLVKEEDVMVPESDRRRRDQANPSRLLRRNKPNQEPAAPRVLFTGVMDARGERAVLALGGSLATSVNEASHLVTDRIRRTVKFLCALGKGMPILSLDWLYQSQKAGCFLPPDEYLVTDPEQEKNFGFSLRNALSRARERKLLEGYEIHVTAGVQPPPPQMGEIINCCGGTVLPSMPRSYKPHRVVVTCPQDIPRCSIPSRLGLPLVSPEFLLTGVLKQEATPEAFLLSNLQMSST